MGDGSQLGPKGLHLFEVWMEITQWLMERTARFPRRLRHSLSDRIDNRALEILEQITEAAYLKRKGPLLAEVDQTLNRLRVLLRLAHQLGLLSHEQFAYIVEKMAEAGRLLGGWRRQVAGRSPLGSKGDSAS